MLKMSNPSADKEAVLEGKSIVTSFEKFSGHKGGILDMKNIDKNWGGKDNFVSILKSHYTKMFQDPYMFSLFDMTDTDANVTADEHGLRLALFLLSFFGDD